MKKKLLIILAVLVCIIGGGVLAYSVYNDDRMVQSADVPASIQTFVSQHFPNTQIISAQIDGLEYQIWLNDNTRIEFDWNHEWDKIESVNTPIPSALIPPAINTYMQQNANGALVTKISKEDSGYEVRVSGNPYEYKFNKAGLYLGLDD